MAQYGNDDREITFEIIEEIGIITSQPTGWTKELNVVAWNGGQAKYDIREWSPHHDRMGRGLTLNEQEMRTIIELLRRRARSTPRRSSPDQGDQRGELPNEAVSEPLEKPLNRQADGPRDSSPDRQADSSMTEPQDDTGQDEVRMEKSA